MPYVDGTLVIPACPSRMLSGLRMDSRQAGVTDSEDFACAGITASEDICYPGVNNKPIHEDTMGLAELGIILYVLYG